MKLSKLYLYLFFSFIVLFYQKDISAAEKDNITITEQLGKNIPLNLEFKNSDGETVVLKNYFTDKPVVFAFVYYKCPGICTPLLTEISSIINKSTLVPGKDYRVVILSMDENEKPVDALEKKQAMFSLIDKEISSDDWIFLTGKIENINNLAASTGFHFKREGTQFIHTTSLMFITKEGRISRYLYPGYKKNSGFSVLPFSFKLAIIDATEGKVIPSIGKLLAFCFSYDPQGRTYVFDILKVVGAGTIFTAGIVLCIWAKLTMRDSWGIPAQHDIKRQSTLITSGPYRFTRNPIYVGLFMVVFGQALALGSWLFFLVYLLYMYFGIAIKKEEQLLTKH